MLVVRRDPTARHLILQGALAALALLGALGFDALWLRMVLAPVKNIYLYIIKELIFEVARFVSKFCQKNLRRWPESYRNVEFLVIHLFLWSFRTKSRK